MGGKEDNHNYESVDLPVDLLNNLSDGSHTIEVAARMEMEVGKRKESKPGLDGDEGGVSVVSIDGKLIAVIGVAKDAANAFSDVTSRG